MSNIIFQNEIQRLLFDAVKICKQRSYYVLKDQLNQSFQELKRVEAECRRDTISSIIRDLQEIEKKQCLLEYEYGKVLSIARIPGVPAIEEYIKCVEKYKKSLVQDKKRLENSSRS